MSGIAGIWLLDGASVPPGLLDRGIARMAHCGLDLTRIWRGTTAALALLDSSPTEGSAREAQPLLGSAGEVLVADARVDNREELIAALRLSSSATDAEIILESYRAWDLRSFERLRGDFALVLFDPRRRLILGARDPFGVRPFFYHHSPGRMFVFASEINALLALVPTGLDEVMIADYLSGYTEAPELTFYKEIRRLPAAHLLSSDGNACSVEPYWNLDPQREMVLASPEEYDEAFRERFVRAVKVRMRACSPIGCMLSGGFDSSSIMCTAYDIADLDGKKKSHTFSSLFPSLPQCDERRYIEAALAGKECVPHFSAGDEISPFEHQAEIISLLAEPTEGMYHTHVALLQAAREHGVRVLLDGSDGDITLFEDFFYLSELALRDRWLRFIAEARQVARIHGLSLSVLFWQYGIRRRLSRRFKDLVRWIFRLKPGRYMDGAMLRPEFAARMNQEERILASVRALQARIRTVRDFQRMLLVSNAVGLGNESLSLIGVWQGVESRFPYYDRDLVEFCLALPPSEKLHRGFARYIGRRSLETLLPEEICWRSTKSEFNDVLAHGMYRFGADRLRELLRHEVLAEYVDTVRLKSAYERFLSKRYTPNDLTNIWRLCSFSHWLQAVSPHSARDRKKNVYC